MARRKRDSESTNHPLTRNFFAPEPTAKGMMIFMDEIELVLPSKDFGMAALEYKKEHFDNQEYELHGSSLFDKIDSYDDWLEQLKNNSNEKMVNPDWVVSTTFFALRKRDKLKYSY